MSSRASEQNMLIRKESCETHAWHEESRMAKESGAFSPRPARFRRLFVGSDASALRRTYADIDIRPDVPHALAPWWHQSPFFFLPPPFFFSAASTAEPSPANFFARGPVFANRTPCLFFSERSSCAPGGNESRRHHPTLLGNGSEACSRGTLELEPQPRHTSISFFDF